MRALHCHLELLDRVRADAEHNSLFTLSRYQTLIMTRLPFNINNIASPARFVTRRHKQTMNAQHTRRKLPKNKQWQSNCSLQLKIYEMQYAVSDKTQKRQKKDLSLIIRENYSSGARYIKSSLRRHSFTSTNTLLQLLPPFYCCILWLFLSCT